MGWDEDNKKMRNRFHNATNEYQGNQKRVLCVCTAGLLRAPTAAKVLANEPFNFNTRAVGSFSDCALIPLDCALVYWADEIVVMDATHKWAVEHFQRELQDMFMKYLPCPIHNLDLTDDYSYNDPILIQILRDKFEKIEWQ